MTAMMPNGPAEADDLDEFLPEMDIADSFALLDIYDQEPSSIGQARPDALATISAGERGPDRDGRPGLPRVSRDGTIFLHDPDLRAPGLRAALDATDSKRLTVAFPFSDLHMFWQERFTRYSQTRLEVYGDKDELREIVLHGDNPPEHVLHLAGTPEYERLRRSCKVSCSIYFALAQWEGTTPRIVFPDGLGLYRLRTTSRHSRRALLGSLQTASRFTGGQLAGLPFELRLTYREVPDPGGMKRNIPIWSLLFRPPEQIALSTATWGKLRDAAIAEGRVLAAQPALAPPSAETWHVAEAEGDVVQEPSDADLANMLAGDSPADKAFWRNTWFGIVSHTIYDQEVARHKFFERYTGGKTDSLAGFLETATNAEAEAMIRQAVDELKVASGLGAPTDVPHAEHGTERQRLQNQRASRYREIFGDDADDFHPEPDDPKPASNPRQPDVDVEHEPTPMDDILDGEIATTHHTDTPAPQDESDDFMPDEEPETLPDAPSDADIREGTRQWLGEVKHRITEGSKNGGSKSASAEQKKAVATILLSTVQGDVGAASKLLRILTTGAPGATGKAREVTSAQAVVIESLAVRDEWQLCAESALRFAVV